jgi:phosphoglycerate dehydrogenase-like enzyme
MLALVRRLPEARDNQAKRVWRGMIGDLTQREDELGGKTLLIVGLGQIGGRLAQLAKAFDMRVVGIRPQEDQTDCLAQRRLRDAKLRCRFRETSLPPYRDKGSKVIQLCVMHLLAPLIGLCRL